MIESIRTIALVVTACGRLDLLEKTLRSFAEYNGYPLEQVIIIDDAGTVIDPHWVAGLLSLDVNKVEVLVNEVNIGQIASIDRAYAKVSSEFIFHCEDDWDFIQKGFIPASISILDHREDAVCVWMRALDDTNGHPFESDKIKTPEGYSYRLLVDNYRKIWSGFTLNPGLRRTVDAMKLHPYATVEKATKGLGKRQRVTESDLSIAYGKLGYRGVIIDSENGGFIVHSGACDHTPSEWENAHWVCFKNKVRKLRRGIGRVVGV